MTHDQDHVDFERLSDFADESLPAPERARVQAHLVDCASCANRLGVLRHLLGAASALPADVAPPGELWSGIHARIVAQAKPTPVAPRARLRGARPWLLAAAAVVLVVVSSTITAVVMKSTSDGTAPAPAAAPVVMLSPAARSVEADYARTASELADALAAQRGRLDPATIAKVEASLRVIDDAIEEARRALAGDPANLTLLDILSANYERKLELLRRANELPSST